MELNFSNKGLTSFDASYLSREVERSSSASMVSSTAADSSLANLLECAPAVKGINLSRNAIHMFIGGETLRHVTQLNLSHNELSVLNPNSLPPALVKLTLAHNHLRDLGALAAFAPALQELDISHNAFTASGLRDLPPSLLALNVRGNEVDSLAALHPLKRLARLDAGDNRFDTLDSLEGLRQLPCLHHLDLRGNPVVTVTRKEELLPVAHAVSAMAPRLATLDGVPLSQAANNSKYRATQAAAARSAAASANTSAVGLASSAGEVSATASAPLNASARGSSPGHAGGGSRARATGVPVALTRSRSGTGTASVATTGAGTARRSSRPRGPPMEVRLMEAKVAELRRLAGENEKKENQLRYERGILIDQIKSCAGVIDSQAQELESLQAEIAALEKEEEALRHPVARVEQTFEQTHASLIAQKVAMSGDAAKQ